MKDQQLPIASNRAGWTWIVGLVALVLIWLPKAGSGHDDIWIYIHSTEILVENGAFENINGARQLVVTSWLLVVLGIPWVLFLPQDGLSIWLGWKVFAFLTYLGGLAVLLRYLTLEAGPKAVLVAVVILAAFPSVGAWAWGGLDSGLFLFGAVTFSIALGQAVRGRDRRHYWLIGLFAGMAFCFSRTDAIWGFLLPLLLSLGAGNAAHRRRLVGLFGLLAVAVATSLVVTQLWTGQPVPNPALVKAGFGLAALLDGLDYWRQWFSQSPAHFATVFLWPLCAWIILRRMTGRSRDDTLSSFAAIALLMDLSACLTGGDWMSEFRFATRTLELKIAAVLILARQRDWCEGVSRATSAAWIGLLAAMVVWASSANGVVVGRRGIVARPPGLTADWVSLIVQGEATLGRWNEANIRDKAGIGGYFETDEWRTRLGSATAEYRPLVFASYQAGYFPRRLRIESGATAVFIDLAGLTDYRLGMPRDQRRSALGLHAGVIDWARSFQQRAGPVRAAGACSPELVYVLGADTKQRILMQEAGYYVEWESAGAVIFGMQSGQPKAAWQDCRAFVT